MSDGGQGWERYRNARLLAHEGLLGLAWPVKALLATGFAGFIALLAQVSVPLPWTPVPFSLQILAVTVAGAYLGRNYGLLSVALYVLAGALGLRVFANQESSGIEVLTGPTAGYIAGFAVAAWLVGAYVERRRARLLDRRTATFLAAALGLAALAAAVAILWVSLNPATFEEVWGEAYGTDLSATRYVVWVVAGSIALGAVAAFLLVKRSQGQGWEKLNLFLVVMAATFAIHLCGVLWLKPSLGYSWPQAIALGSLVFLPFDIVKAGMAVALSAAFLPSVDEENRRPLHAQD